MSKLHLSLQKAIESKHVSNTSKQHEQWFANILKSFGAVEKTLDVGISTEEIRNQLTSTGRWDSVSSVPDFFYIPQPLGSQNTPDFLVYEKGHLFYVELKSSKDEKITWNGGYPHDGYIYLFSTGKHDAQTVFMGEDAWSPAVKKELMDFAASQKQRTDEFNLVIGREWLEEEVSMTLWQRIKFLFTGEKPEPKKYRKPGIISGCLQGYYTRNMFIDRERYYSRERRNKSELAVFEFIKNKLKTSEVTNVAAK